MSGVLAGEGLGIWGLHSFAAFYYEGWVYQAAAKGFWFRVLGTTIMEKTTGNDRIKVAAQLSGFCIGPA